MKIPKLLLVADTYYPQVDGVLRFMEEFIKRSTDAFEITVLVPKLGPEKRIEGVKTIFLEISKILKLSTYSTMKFSFGNFKKLKKSVREADLVFVQDSAFMGLLAIKYAQKFQKKVVYYTHQIIWKQFQEIVSPFWAKLFTSFIKKSSLKAMNKCDLVVLPYQGLKEELNEMGLHAETQVARLGIDINRFVASKDKSLDKNKLNLPNKRIIGYVGRISGEKNLSILLTAFNKLNQQKYFLLIVGDGQKEILDQFKEHQNCKVTGFVNNVEDYLRAIDIFVMPSLTETTSLATLEAMSCGLPVIVTKVGFMEEYVVRDHNGLFFPRENPTMLALKIEKLFHKPEIREILGKNARKTIAYSFSWERSINKIKKTLSRVYYQQ